MNTTQDIFVQNKCGAYTTNRVRGESGSSTSSARAAAERLATKLFGPALQRVEEVDPGNHYATLWRAVADETVFAWCWSNGRLEFGTEVPSGAIALCQGPRRAVHAVLASVCPARLSDSASRHVETLVGARLYFLEEAGDEAAAFQALDTWLKRHAAGNSKRCTLSVVFANGASVTP